MSEAPRKACAQHSELDAQTDRVARGLRREFGERSAIRSLRRLSGGASRETWDFVLELDGESRRLVLRRDPEDERPRIGSMSLEAAAIEAAAAVGVPVPRIVTAGEHFGGTGTAFIVSEHIEGETLGPRIVRSPELADARAVFAAECGAALAKIHSIPADDIDGIQAAEPVGELSEQFAEAGGSSAAVALALACLRDHRLDSRPATVVHGDFRNGNLIIGAAGLRSVLDWELVHLGDPMNDLGWLCTPVWGFGGRGPVGGVGNYDDLLDGYEDEAGWRPELADVLWWKLFGSTKWAVACLRAARAFDLGERRTIDAAALARRVGENELDLLETIEEAGW